MPPSRKPAEPWRRAPPSDPPYRPPYRPTVPGGGSLKTGVYRVGLVQLTREATFRTVSIIYLIFRGLDYSRGQNTETGVGLKGGPIVPRGICALDWTYVLGPSTLVY